MRYETRLAGYFDFPVTEPPNSEETTKAVGRIAFSSICIVQASSPYEALAMASEDLRKAFSKSVGYENPTVEETYAKIHRG